MFYRIWIEWSASRVSVCIFGFMCVPDLVYHSKWYRRVPHRELTRTHTAALSLSVSLRRLSFVVLSSSPFFLYVYSCHSWGGGTDSVVICCRPRCQSTRVSLTRQICACIRANASMCTAESSACISVAPTTDFSRSSRECHLTCNITQPEAY